MIQIVQSTVRGGSLNAWVLARLPSGFMASCFVSAQSYGLPSSWDALVQSSESSSTVRTPSAAAASGSQSAPPSCLAEAGQDINFAPVGSTQSSTAVPLELQERLGVPTPSSSQGQHLVGTGGGVFAHQLFFSRHYARAHRDVQRPVFPLPSPIKELVDLKFDEMKQRKLLEPVAPPLEQRSLQQSSRRTGAVAIKAGMTQEWDEWGARVPLTVLFIDDCQVVGIKSPERNGYRALQVGSSYAKQKSLSGASAGFYISQGVPFKRKMVEFPVSADAVLPVGTHITAAHWVPGQSVDVTGWTKDKGFQGVMKKWGFKGLPASHGTSLAHRAPGAIGCRADPGRVWKGKKMPGQMGKERRTVHNCLVYKVDPQRHLVYIRGQVPGPAGSHVYIRDALNVKFDRRLLWEAPFPTCLEDPSGLPVRVWKNPKDPYHMYSEETDYFPINWKKKD